MVQSRTHNCGELRIGDIGKTVTLCGFIENIREVGSALSFLVLRDFYGVTQVVAETEEMVNLLKGLNKESTVSVTGTVRERDSKNKKLPTGRSRWCLRRSRCWAAAATTSCPSRSIGARRPTRPPA